MHATTRLFVPKSTTTPSAFQRFKKLRPKFGAKFAHCFIPTPPAQQPYTILANMTSATVIMPPARVRGMRELDRDLFTQVIEIPTLTVPKLKLHGLLKYINSYLFKMENFRPTRVVHNSMGVMDACRKIYLRPDKVRDFNCLPLENLKDLDINSSCFAFQTVELTYQNWGAHDIFKSILPENKETLTSYSIVGHIVHVNLRVHLLPYKQLIGQVLLDKVPNCRTVVNKESTIDNIFRNFTFECLAGEKNYIVETKENGFIYKFDFSKVYWNPRLSTEHARIYGKLKSNDIVYDVFAGVGPFAVPAVCRNCTVFANDLNPESINWLKYNLTRNPVKTQSVQTYNLDGREFLLNIVKEDLSKQLKEQLTSKTNNNNNNIYIIMNLPAMAVEFLDVIRGLLKSEANNINFNDIPANKYPIIYCYTFGKGNIATSISNIQAQVEESLRMPLEHTNTDMDVRFVRNVAPNKNMYCIELRLNQLILATTYKIEHINFTLKIEEEFPPNNAQADASSTIADNNVATDEVQLKNDCEIEAANIIGCKRGADSMEDVEQAFTLPSNPSSSKKQRTESEINK